MDRAYLFYIIFVEAFQRHLCVCTACNHTRFSINERARTIEPIGPASCVSQRKQFNLVAQPKIFAALFFNTE